MRIYVDSSVDPYYHIALEHYYLYEDKDIETSPILLIYRNEECVVFGNFQNPWLECNINYCIQNGIKFVRRFSGGGCVYHDLGNINFCYIGPKDSQSKNILSNYILNFLQSKNIFAHLGEKSDLLLEGKKISGSAFRETKNRTLHHCTLLYNANLEKLHFSLSSPLNKVNREKNVIYTNALRSRPAVVRDLSQFHWNSADELIDNFVEHMQDYTLINPELDLKQNIWKEFDFIWGKTPDFELQIKERVIRIRGGQIVEVLCNKELILKVKIPLPAKWDEIVFILGENTDQIDYFKKIGFIQD